MHIKDEHLHFISFEQIRKINYMTRCRQQLWPGAFNIYKPAILVILNRQVLHLQTGWISDKYFQTHISQTGGAESKELFFTIFLGDKPMSANWLWSWFVDPDFPEGGNNKDLRMIRYRFTKILNLEHNLSNLFLCLFCSISLPWINSDRKSVV